MPDKKISQLTNASLPLAGTEEVALVQGGQTLKATTQDIADLAGGGGGGIFISGGGTDVPKSASYVTTPTIHGGTPGATLMTVNIFYTLTANSVVALKWTSKSGKTAITSIPPTGLIPQSPGVIFTVNKIGT